MPSLGAVRRSGSMETLRQSPSLCRAADVLYLLGRGAQLEHLHMINVQYASHQPGPTFKDVKNRLIALRGSGMPGSFSWSYKRNYKDTFIWCDLFDDDFILPLCETGEYVLKALELFNASQDKDVECKELHMPTQSLPIRNSRVSSPVKPLRSSTWEEQFDLESEVSMAIKKSLILISDAGNVTFDSSLNLSKQTMNKLSHNKRALEVGHLDHSDISNTGTYASLDAVENQQFPDQQRSKCNAARTEKATEAKPCYARSQTVHRKTSIQRGACSRGISPAVGNPGEDTDYPRNEMRGVVPMAGNSLIANQCSAGSQTSFRETSLQGGVAKDCNELVDRSAAAIIKKDEMLAFSSSPTTIPNAKRRTWEKEINKDNMCTGLSQSKSSDDEHLSPHREVHKSSSPCLSASDDPFLYNVLRKATRLGSPRPRMCRGVDVVNSTRARTKMHFRSKPREVGIEVSKKPERQPKCLVDETSKNNNSCSKSPKIHSSYTSSERPAKELKSLSHYFETRERTSSVIKLMSETPSIEEKPRQQLISVQADPQALSDAALATNPPRPEFRSSGNDALDASYRKTMEVLAKLPVRGVS
ncbi:protein SOSEKI 4-like [Physcomitrium patens]|uniref:SOSEKI DIX-like domain-containing protein n=1 Tax=Physcomitrium patens TaxID=3218 RepID=A0A2K1IYX3_PHYPA|nr:hypothetical protein PHYPA_024292 [Physcomitrium patens]